MENIALEKWFQLVSSLLTVVYFLLLFLLLPALLLFLLSSLRLPSSVEVSYRQRPRPRPTILCRGPPAPETDP